MNGLTGSDEGGIAFGAFLVGGRFEVCWAAKGGEVTVMKTAGSKRRTFRIHGDEE